VLIRMALPGLSFVLILGSVWAWFVVTQPLFATPNASSGRKADPRHLETHVRVLAHVVTPRDWAHPENLERAAAYIQAQFEAAHGSVREQRYDMNGRSYRNVIASFGPDVAATVVVGAHYDAFGLFPGADDNASGVSGLLELARLLDGAPLSGRVDLVAFALEEPTEAESPGLFRSASGGSAIHAASLAQRGLDVHAVINLEMIGYFTDRPGSQRYPLELLTPFYPARGDFIAVVGKVGQGSIVRQVKAAIRSVSSVPVHSLSAPAFIEGVDWSDHTNYWNAGYPAVMITDTAVYRNPNYHTGGDTPDTLDYPRMAHVVTGVLAAVHTLVRAH